MNFSIVNSAQLIKEYYPYLVLLVSTINVFGILFGLVRSYFFHDPRGDTIWKVGLIVQVFVFGIWAILNVLPLILPIKSTVVIEERADLIFPSNVKIKFPHMGQAGASDWAITQIVSFGGTLLKSLYNGFLRVFIGFSFQAANILLASNLPYDTLFSSLQGYIVSILGLIFLILLIWKLIEYALAVNGLGNLETAKIELVSLFYHLLMALMFFVFVIFLFRLVQILMVSFASAIPERFNANFKLIAFAQGTIIDVPNVTIAEGGQAKYATKAFINLSKLIWEPAGLILRMNIETIKETVTTEQEKIIMAFSSNDTIKELLKLKFDWEMFLALGILIMLGYQALVLIIMSLKRIFWTVILTIIAPIFILLRGNRATANLGDTVIRDLTAAIFAPLIIVVLVVFWFYLGFPGRWPPYTGEPTGSLGIPEAITELIAGDEELARKQNIALLFQLIISLMFVELIKQLPFMASSIMSGLIQAAGGIGQTLGRALQGGISSSAGILGAGIGLIAGLVKGVTWAIKAGKAIIGTGKSLLGGLFGAKAAATTATAAEGAAAAGGSAAAGGTAVAAGGTATSGSAAGFGAWVPSAISWAVGGTALAAGAWTTGLTIANARYSGHENAVATGNKEAGKQALINTGLYNATSPYSYGDTTGKLEGMLGFDLKGSADKQAYSFMNYQSYNKATGGKGVFDKNSNVSDFIKDYKDSVNSLPFTSDYGFVKQDNDSVADTFYKNLSDITGKDLSKTSMDSIDNKDILKAINKTGNELGLTKLGINQAGQSFNEIYKASGNKSDAVASALSSLTTAKNFERNMPADAKAAINSVFDTAKSIQDLKNINKQIPGTRYDLDKNTMNALYVLRKQYNNMFNNNNK